MRWIIVFLVLIGAGVAASWGLGLFDGPEAPEAPPAPRAPPLPPKSSPLAEGKAKPLDTAAWLLAHSQRTQQDTAPRPSGSGDELPCGESASPCPAGSRCLGGACALQACGPDTAPTLACVTASGQAGRCCAGSCSELASDRANCGGCGRACGAGVDCIGGRCQARGCGGRMAGTSCVAEWGAGICCREQCVDPARLLDDARNCGGCGHACASGLSCVQGACVDPSTGRMPSWNCTESGHTCPSDQFCVIDACYPRECGAGSDGQLCPGTRDGQIGHCCSGSCHDLFSDNDNCRACGVRCDPGQVCRNGECR